MWKLVYRWTTNFTLSVKFLFLTLFRGKNSHFFVTFHFLVIGSDQHVIFHTWLNFVLMYFKSLFPYYVIFHSVFALCSFFTFCPGVFYIPFSHFVTINFLCNILFLCNISFKPWAKVSRLSSKLSWPWLFSDIHSIRTPHPPMDWCSYECAVTLEQNDTAEQNVTVWERRHEKDGNMSQRDKMSQ